MPLNHSYHAIFHEDELLFENFRGLQFLSVNAVRRFLWSENIPRILRYSRAHLLAHFVSAPPWIGIKVPGHMDILVCGDVVQDLSWRLRYGRLQIRGQSRGVAGAEGIDMDGLVRHGLSWKCYFHELYCGSGFLIIWKMHASTSCIAISSKNIDDCWKRKYYEYRRKSK